jgi:GNAT superfamily N-acetyltransferase
LITISYLLDYPQYLPKVANWIFDEWGYLIPDLTLQEVVSRLQTQLNRDSIPLTLVAVYNDLPVGTASIILQDMSSRPDLFPWLASVYVVPEFRNQGIGSQLVKAVGGNGYNGISQPACCNHVQVTLTSLEGEMVRIGIVGAGIWGSMHARAYTQNPMVELVAVCDLDKQKAIQLARKYGHPQVFTNLDEMLELELDGISVVTPDHAHTEVVLKAAAKGVHILVEKPLATTLEECASAIDATEKAGVFLMVDWHNRWNPPYYYAWKTIREGELGDVRYIYYRLSDTVYVPTKMLPWASQIGRASCRERV